MKREYLVGTTIPIVSPETRCSSFGRSRKNFELMHRAGLRIVRAFCGYPFADAEKQIQQEAYKDFKAVAELYAQNGIETMGTVTNDSQYMVDNTGAVSCVIHAPEWMGSPEEERYYRQLFECCKFMAQDNAERVRYWQIGNENDTDVFRGRLDPKQNIRWLLTAARGIKAGNPQAKCITNLAGLDKLGQPGKTHSVHPAAAEMLERTFCIENSPFDIIGLDAYFGSWMPGRPEYWHQYIDDAHRVTGKPVLISEWGYSTMQRGEPRPESDRNRHFNSDVCRWKDWDAPGMEKWMGKDHTEELQAEYIRHCVKIFAENEHCIGDLFFQWQDQERCWQCGEPDCPSECAWGCIRTDGTPKPGFYALMEEYNRYFG